MVDKSTRELTAPTPPARRTAAPDARRPHRVACLAFDGITPFELGTVAEVFAVPRPDLDVPWWYSFSLCAERPGIHRAVGGFDVIVNHDLGLLRRADTVVIPSVPDVRGSLSEPVVQALRAAYGRGARLVSICTGAFALAQAGILDGLEATTHWRHADLMQQRFPRVRVNPSVLYVDHGRVLTSAGTAAGIDLCLHVVRRDHGAEVAGRLARRMVVAAHREGGQAQFIERPVADLPRDDPIAAAMLLARERLGHTLRVADLAERAHLSPRQFERRFHDATGLSPGKWMTVQRVLASLTMLETSDDPVDAIALRVGLGPAGFRRHFRAEMGLAPSAYRRLYRSSATQSISSPGQ